MPAALDDGVVPGEAPSVDDAASLNTDRLGDLGDGGATLAEMNRETGEEGVSGKAPRLYSGAVGVPPPPCDDGECPWFPASATPCGGEPAAPAASRPGEPPCDDAGLPPLA